MTNWLIDIKKAKKEALLEGNLKKVRYEFENGQEMVEEYNLDTNIVTRRAWRVKSKVGGDENWEIELGDPQPNQLQNGNSLIKESSTQPVVSKRITKTNIEWRIRNLPYPLSNYSVTADQQEKCLIVRTVNKKYFKKLKVPELERVNLLPDQKNVEFTHKFNTLIITYKKPNEVLMLEKAIFEEIQKIKPKTLGEVGDCRPS